MERVVARARTLRFAILRRVNRVKCRRNDSRSTIIIFPPLNAKHTTNRTAMKVPSLALALLLVFFVGILQAQDFIPRCGDCWWYVVSFHVDTICMSCDVLPIDQTVSHHIPSFAAVFQTREAMERVLTMGKESTMSFQTA